MKSDPSWWPWLLFTLHPSPLLWRWGDADQHYRLLNDLRDPVGHICGRPDEGSRLHLLTLGADRDRRPARQHIVKLVGAGVGVRRLGLSRLETIESHKELLAAKQILLHRLVDHINCVIYA